MDHRTLIGEILVDGGWIDLQQLRAGLAWQKRCGGRLGSALLQLGYLDEWDLAATLGRQLGIPEVDVAGREVPAEVLSLVPGGVLRRHRVLPLALLEEGPRGPLLLATSDPLDAKALDDVALASGKRVRPVIAAGPDIDRALSRHLDGHRPGEGGGPAAGAALADALDPGRY